MGVLDRIKEWLSPDYSNLPRPDSEPVGGLPARALVLATEGTSAPESGGWRVSSHSTWIRKKLDLQLVGRPEQRAKVSAYLSEHEFEVTRVGTEVPVRVHDQTGAILGLDFAAWEVEAARLPRDHHATGGGPLVTSG